MAACNNPAPGRDRAQPNDRPTARCLRTDFHRVRREKSCDPPSPGPAERLGGRRATVTDSAVRWRTFPRALCGKRGRPEDVLELRAERRRRRDAEVLAEP